MRSEDLHALLELRLTPGLGDLRLRRLLRRHASPAAALDAFRTDPDGALGWTTETAGAREGGASSGTRRFPRRATESARTRDSRDRRIGRCADAVRALGIQVVLETDRRYPARLRQLYDPPPVLFARGDPGLCHMAGVAVVGSRIHTEYGASTARLVTGAIAREGVVIISGLARGIDSVAHEAALDVGGRTIAVLGCGPDVVYPPENDRLQRRIVEAGLLLSELPPGEPALPHHFPKRNRLIAGLAHAVVVVEGGSRSGALITAGQAVDLGREVFAVPGPIGRATSEGTNELIQSLQAHLLTSPSDVLSRLRAERPPPRIVPLAPRAGTGTRAASRASSVHDPVLAVLGAESAPVEVVAQRANLTETAALIALLELELEGHVRRLPGMRFVRS